MPTRPPALCARCHHAHLAGQCPQAPRSWTRKPETWRQGSTRAWRTFRAAWLRAHPLCMDCGDLATVVCHKPGTDYDLDRLNPEAIEGQRCRPCDAAETARQGNAAQQRTSQPPTRRTVILLCGPSGSGKTTAARNSGLAVYDRDDPRWSSDRQFDAALTALAASPDAHAVVIRSCATSTSRARVAAQIGATGTYLLTADPSTLIRRVTRRAPGSGGGTVRAIRDWHARHDRRDRVPDFPGWDRVYAGPLRSC